MGNRALPLALMSVSLGFSEFIEKVCLDKMMHNVLWLQDSNAPVNENLYHRLGKNRCVTSCRKLSHEHHLQARVAFMSIYQQKSIRDISSAKIKLFISFLKGIVVNFI